MALVRPMHTDGAASRRACVCLSFLRGLVLTRMCLRCATQDDAQGRGGTCVFVQPASGIDSTWHDEAADAGQWLQL